MQKPTEKPLKGVSTNGRFCLFQNFTLFLLLHNIDFIIMHVLLPLVYTNSQLNLVLKHFLVWAGEPTDEGKA